MVNTYFDVMRKLQESQRAVQVQPIAVNHDLSGGVNQRRPLNSQQSLSRQDSQGVDFNQTQLVNYAAYLYGFGMACLWLLMLFSSAKSEFLAGLFFGGLSSSFIYTGGIGLKYYILGDLLVMLTFGPLSVLFSFIVQCGESTPGPLLLALPLALSTEAILHSKHLREMDKDKQAGVISLAVLLGKQGSYFLFTLLLFLPYLVFVVFGTQYSLSLVLPLITMPYAFQLERKLREQGPTKAVSTSAAKLNLGISILLIIGCIFAGQIPFVNVHALHRT